jgi:hypothetical protein
MNAIVSGAAALAVVAACGWGGVRRAWDFQSDAPGAPAAGFRVEAGRWEVAADGENRVLHQSARSAERTFNLALVPGTSFKDLDISVRIRAVAGETDRGGGVVWRAKDARNYYIARFNPLEDNVRVYKVEGGRRTQLDHADTPSGDGRWHVLRITMVGRDITGYFDGRKLLVAEDDTFPDAGMVGLWSKADAQSDFDDLTVEQK